MNTDWMLMLLPKQPCPLPVSADAEIRNKCIGVLKPRCAIWEGDCPFATYEGPVFVLEIFTTYTG